MISGETVAWEESEFQSIANNYSLLQSFQTLKYINGKRHSDSGMDHCERRKLTLCRSIYQWASWSVPIRVQLRSTEGS